MTRNELIAELSRLFPSRDFLITCDDWHYRDGSKRTEFHICILPGLGGTTCTRARAANFELALLELFAIRDSATQKEVGGQQPNVAEMFGLQPESSIPSF